MSSFDTGTVHVWPHKGEVEEISNVMVIDFKQARSAWEKEKSFTLRDCEKKTTHVYLSKDIRKITFTGEPF